MFHRNVKPRLNRACKMVGAALGAALVISEAMTLPAQAEVQYPVAWTGIGIYPRSAPSMDSAKVGAALPDGAGVSIACEVEGQSVSNGYNVSTVWERLSDGTYLPNAFIASGVDGWTPGVPRCDSAPAPTPPAPEQAQVIHGTPIHSGQWLSYALWDHYLWGKGAKVVIAFDYITADANLVSWMKQLPADGIGRTYEANPVTDGDVYWAMGAFAVARTSQNCYVVHDHYDFYPDKPTNLPLQVYNLYQVGGAQAFDTWASGCM